MKHTKILPNLLLSEIDNRTRKEGAARRAKKRAKTTKNTPYIQEVIERLLTTVILLLQFSVKQYTIMLIGPENGSKRGSYAFASG